MTIGVRCGSCNRELLLVQLVQPSDGFVCPAAWAPSGERRWRKEEAHA
jgi:hypothetical protein